MSMAIAESGVITPPLPAGALARATAPPPAGGICRGPRASPARAFAPAPGEQYKKMHSNIATLVQV